MSKRFLDLNCGFTAQAWLPPTLRSAWQVLQGDQVYDYKTKYVSDMWTTWHTYSWMRDYDGWWSLAIDGIPQLDLPSWQQIDLTSFTALNLGVCWPEDQIEWVTVSIPEPATMILFVLGGLSVPRRKR